MHVGISTVNKRDQPCLQFDFPEDLTADMARDAIAIWREELKRYEGKKVTLIFNCQHMQGFETSARRMWQEMLSESKLQTADIWVVCNNMFIMTAAKTMGLLTGYKIKTAKTLQEVAVAP